MTELSGKERIEEAGGTLPEVLAADVTFATLDPLSASYAVERRTAERFADVLIRTEEVAATGDGRQSNAETEPLAPAATLGPG